MEDRNIYEDIAKRTQGDIYIGVVGPVRTGKSTFIKDSWTQLLSLISRRAFRSANDCPICGGPYDNDNGAEVHPREAVEIKIDNNASFRVRMIDCVGYMSPAPRLYRGRAAEKSKPRGATRKCPSTQPPGEPIGHLGALNNRLVVTTDGSISDIPAMNTRRRRRG